MQNKHLWLRIAAAPLPVGFNDKIADEFSWNSKQTTEAIEEYRRFVYLSQISEHPISPPREVDLVWHMHLLYTRHYTGAWRDLLEKPLHHEPAPVGTKDNAFRKQYGDTRALYLNEFESFATEKLWPSLAVLKRRDRAGVLALVSFVTTVVMGILAAITQNMVFGVIGAIAFVTFFISVIFAATANGGKSSFGVSSGNGDGDGCGD